VNARLPVPIKPTGIEDGTTLNLEGGGGESQSDCKQASERERKSFCWVKDCELLAAKNGD
jgi:hypothetical protein